MGSLKIISQSAIQTLTCKWEGTRIVNGVNKRVDDFWTWPARTAMLCNCVVAVIDHNWETLDATYTVTGTPENIQAFCDTMAESDNQ